MDSPIVPTQHKKIWIALKQRNLDQLEKTFWSVSDPNSSNYGKYLTSEQVTDLVAPLDSDIENVIGWLRENGVSDIELVRNKDAIKAVFTIEKLENLFNAKLYYYAHPNGRRIIRSPNPITVPDHIKKHIDLVHGINDFPPVTKSVNRHRKIKKEINNVSSKITFATPGVPVIAGAVGVEGGIEIVYVPICLSGKPSTDYNCNGTIRSLILAAQYKTIDSYKQMIYPNPNNCENDDGIVLCVAELMVPAYQFLTGITLSANFSTGGVYTYNHPFPVVTTPPVIPQSIWNLYGIPNDFMITKPKYSQSVVEFEQQYYSPTDLALFFDEMGIPGSETPVTVIGPNDPSNPGVEASLDIQWIMAMSPGVPTVFWSNAANATDEIDDILTWALALGNTPNPPLVHSISYGMPASLVDTFLGTGYLARSDIEFQKLATQGLTLIIADGDSGAGDLGAPPYMYPQCTTLNPDWPSQSPYVAAVGSTYMTPLAHSICYHPESMGGIDCTVGQPIGEVGVSLNNGLFWTTGGGFANTQKMPDYQTAFVQNYISGTTLPPYNTFNVSGRAYPDYSAVGHNLLTVVGGDIFPVDGTSASAPIFAGIVSLLNEIRAMNGMPPMGFINPLFYNIAARTPYAFNDVVLGQNKCSDYTFDGNDALCCPAAYIAESGWDAVTGLGTPNFNILKNEVLYFPTP